MRSDQPLRFVFFAATGFDSLLSGRTRRLAEALVNEGHAVAFVELPSLRNTLEARFRFGSREVGDPPVQVLRLPPLPGRGRWAGGVLNAGWTALAIRLLRRWLPELDRSVLLTSTPWWAEVVARLPSAVRCCDYIDHVSVQAGPGREAMFARWDEILLQASDMIATVSEPLRRHLEGRFRADRIFMVPNGVRGEWLHTPPEPVPRASLVHRPDRPVAGFLGSLYEWIDVDLLIEAARRLPDVEFALVGPQRRGVSIDALLALPNVRCSPPVPFERVPAVVQAFDVCLIPFKRDIIAEFADPLKLYEYCALGKPVVSSVEFQVDGQAAPITVGLDAEAFAAAIREAITDNTPELERERRAFAARHTWANRARDLVSAVNQVRQECRRSSSNTMPEA